MEKKIPSAEKFFQSIVGEHPDEFNGSIIEIMIEFAKLHVEACKEEIAKQPLIRNEYIDRKGITRFVDNTRFTIENSSYEFVKLEVNSKMVIDSYPLENIK